MTSSSFSNKPAWVQLYEARNVSFNPDVRPPGRPPAPIPRRKVGLTLSQGEIMELEAWQERFSHMLRRKVSTGETVGILARICSARLARLENLKDDEDLTQLVERMVSAE
jgi:hypothetical protein